MCVDKKWGCYSQLDLLKLAREFFSDFCSPPLVVWTFTFYKTLMGQQKVIFRRKCVKMYYFVSLTDLF